MALKKSGMLNAVTTFVKGMLMGGADVIPGVSGGTVALIVGIYQRLVTAISRFDLTLLGFVRRRRFGDAARHVDLAFLVALGCGILTSIVLFGGLMNELLRGGQTRPFTLAAFFGMILASTVLVVRLIEVRCPRDVPLLGLWGIAGAMFAYELTCLPQATLEPTYPYLFLCGMVAICAMILPGISGAYILLILGAYAYLTDILKALPKGEITTHSLLAVAVFAAGCAIGLLGFSKLLRWLLAYRHSQTMAILCGFMIGALGKIWPFQEDLTPMEEKLKHKFFQNVLPEAVDAQVVAVAAVVVAALLFVFALDWISRHEKAKPA